MNINEKIKNLILICTSIKEKLNDKARFAGICLKDYLNDEKNIKHISIIIYDLLPLGIKLGLRYENFHEKFSKNFTTIRNQILNQKEIK
jgi:hypothetical protein